MTYLLANYWLPLLLALVLGGAVGFITFVRPGNGWWPRQWPGWLKLLAIAFVLGALAAWLRWVPGTLGHYLETAVLLLAAYIIGCLLGSFIASLSGESAARTTPAVAAKPEPVKASPVHAEADETPENPSEAGHPGAKPKGIAQASGKPDDLQLISGVGPKNEKLLHRLGIFHFHQIAEWNTDNIAWVDSYLKFKGRITREDWVGQAKRFAAGKK